MANMVVAVVMSPLVRLGLGPACHSRVVAFITLALTAVSVQADPHTWLGTLENNHWDNGANWLNGVPGFGDEANIPVTTYGPLVQNGLDVHIGHLSVLGGHMTIEGAFESQTGHIYSGGVVVNGEHGGGVWGLQDLELHVGYGSGSGALTLTNGGHLDFYVGEFTGSIRLGYSFAGETGNGTVNIGSSASDAASAPGHTTATMIYSDNADAASVKTLQFNHTANAASPYYFTRTGASGGGAVMIGHNVYAEGSDLSVVVTAGDTVFQGQNYYLKGTYLNGGTLHVSHDNQLGGASSSLHFNGGSLGFLSAFDISGRTMTWDATNGGGFVLANGVNQTISQMISGGPLRVSGPGQLNLTSALNVSALEVTQSRVSLTQASTIGTLEFVAGSGPNFRVESTANLEIGSLNGLPTDAMLSVSGTLTVKEGNYYGHVVTPNLIKTDSGDLYLGGETQITAVNVTDGRLSLIGSNNHHLGTVHVNGANAEFGMTHGGTITSTLNVSQGQVYIGGNTTTVQGAVTVSGSNNAGFSVVSGGTVHLGGSSGNLNLASASGSVGTFSVGGLPGDSALTPGHITAEGGGQSIHGGSGTATVVFNHTDNSGSYTFGMPISGSAKVVVEFGTTTFDKMSTYTGGTEINGGTLLVSGGEGIDSVLGVGNVTVGAEGTLGGSGHVFGSTTVHGTLSPGESIGDMTFFSSLILESESKTIIEIEGIDPGQYDTIATTGLNSELFYGGTLEIHFINEFLPGEDPIVLTLFSHAGLLPALGNFSAVNINAPGYGGTFNPATGEVTIYVVPEAATWMLLAMGASVLVFRRKRRRAFCPNF
jgi:autotransporter-associated beta strand protein